MRLLKPLLAAAAVLAITAPAASALADPSWGGHDRGYHRTYESNRGYGRYREARGEEAWRREQAWRDHQYWAHRRWEQRHGGWDY
ncbi:MAG TPA: hypothetical protein VGI79_10055 [Caulobacteraceae bacterium]|jgi:hypothetical protein